MIVLASTHKRVIAERDYACKKAHEWMQLSGQNARYAVEAQQELLSAYYRIKQLELAKGVSPFSKEDLRKLLALCHPDKHGGKPMAEEMTQKLLKMRGA